MSIFTGSAPAICTPFTPAGHFNYDAYEKLIHFQIENGTDALVACGTTGEAVTLSRDEQLEVVRAAVSIAKEAGAKYGRKVPVIAGAGGNDTAKCLSLGRDLAAIGADALMFATPYYNKPSQRGLLQHFTQLAAALDIPLVLYNVPSRTAVNMQAKTLAELAKLPNIVAVKEASNDIGQIAEICQLCEGQLDVYSGNDDQILPILSLGGKGVISTVANIAPRMVHDVVAKFFAGDLTESRRLQLSLIPLVRVLFADVNPTPVKAALNMLDFNMGSCRLPLTDADDTILALLRREMSALGIL